MHAFVFLDCDDYAENEFFRQVIAKSILSLAPKVLNAAVGGELGKPHPTRSRSSSSTVDICPVAGLFFNGFTKLVRR